MKIKFLFIVLLLLASCRAHVKKSEKTADKVADIEKSEIQKNADSTEFIIHTGSAKKVDSQKIDINESNAEIEGKTNENVPFLYSRTRGKDTLETFAISGNANFKIKSYYYGSKELKNSEHKNKDTTKTESKNNLAVRKDFKSSKIAEKASKENIVEVLGTTAPVYLIIGIALIVFIAITLIFKNLKK